MAATDRGSPILNTKTIHTAVTPYFHISLPHFFAELYLVILQTCF